MARRAGSYAPGKFRWGPVRQPIIRLPVQIYQQQITGVPLVGGQAQGKISAAGAASLSVGPAGLGVTWIPASLTIQTTSGVNDTSTCQVYLGPPNATDNNLLLGTIYPGGIGVASFALPPMTAGQYLTAVWSGGNSGDVATINVVGTMNALAPLV